MPVISARKVRTPAGGDAYNLTTDLRLLGQSIGGIVPVASATERAAVVSAMSSEGSPIGVDNPLFVYRADMSPVGGVEFSVDGTDWFPLSEYDSDWKPLSGLGGWAGGSGNSPEFRQIGNRVTARGVVTRSGAAVTANFAGVSVGTLPAGIGVPPDGREVQTPILSNVKDLGWRLIGTDLRIRAHDGAPSLTTSSYFTLDGLEWLVD
jgi:hypothetical protein